MMQKAIATAAFILMMAFCLISAEAQEIYIPSVPNNGGIAGKVISTRGPLSGAKVLLETGASTFTDMNGEYTISNIPAGSYKIEIGKSGYKTAHGTVVVEPGNIKSVLIKLSPVNTQSSPEQLVRKERKPESTMMYISACPSKDISGGFKNYGKMWWVSAIRVEERRGDKRWSDMFPRPSDRDERKRTLRCDDATVGKEYRIEIEWHALKGTDTKTRYWTEKLEFADQEFVYDAPGGY